jgi:hypothetical protein
MVVICKNQNVIIKFKPMNNIKKQRLNALLLGIIALFSACRTTQPTTLNLNQDLYPIKVYNKWGYISYVNDSINIAVLPQYDSTLLRYENNYLVLTSDKKWRALQSDFSLSNQIYQPPMDTGAYPPRYFGDKEGCFNLKPICINCEAHIPTTKYVDKYNKEQFRVEGKGCVFCEEGYALVYYRTPFEHGFLSETKNYVIDTFGHKVFEIPKNGTITLFKNKATIWHTNDSYRSGLLNNKGEVILPDIYQHISFLDDSLALVMNYGKRNVFGRYDAKYKFALFDFKKRQFLTKFEFDNLDNINGFTPNLMKGKIANKMLYINKRGVVVWKEP